MPKEISISRIVHERRIGRTRRGRVSRTLGRILLLTAAVSCAAGAWILLSPLSLPEPDLKTGTRPAGARFYDRTGRLLVEAGSARAAESRWYALNSTEPDCVLGAFLAAHNLTLAEIKAPDVLGGARAIADGLTGAEDLAGDAAAELLAMRGWKNSLWNRARLAGALGSRYGKWELAEWLINVRLYGRGTVGIDDAALTFFGVHAGSLTDAGCAALEAAAQSPKITADPNAWKTARNTLLSRMHNAGFVEKTDWGHAMAEPILPKDMESVLSAGGPDTLFGGKLPILDSFLRLAVDRLGGRFPQEELPRAGIRVFTTMDLDFELQVLCAAQNLLAPPENSSAALSTLEGGSCDLAAFLGPPAEVPLPEDFALAVIDPSSGEVLAYFDSARGQDPVARGAAGTALLPFVYLSAFARGFSPASMLLDIPRPGLSEDPKRVYRGPISARTALQQRALAASDALSASIGGDHIGHSLALLGLAGEEESGLSLEERMEKSTDLLSITRAYATLAGGGLEAADSAGGSAVILRVEQGDGTPLNEFSGRQTRRVFGSDLAYLVQDILSDPSGHPDLNAPALAGSRSSVAAMPAEDPRGEGAWAFAFTPAFSVGVRSRAYAGEGADALPPWTLAQAAAGWALHALPLQTWTEPPGIVRRDVCVPSGLLPSRYCPTTESDIFLAGNEPVQTDSYYRPIAVNRETGRLATLWTPIQLVDEKVFFMLEGEARAWAEGSGFPLPPTTYDTLPDSFPFFEKLHLSNPAPLSVVRGKISIRGAAAEAGMERYLLQAGSGLYPTVWYTLGSGEKPVQEGVLGEWDTSGADGVWSIQLTAVFSGGKILTVAIPVTLDNTPPSIRWVQPSAPMRISADVGEAVVLQVDVTDDIGIEAVEFLLDGNVRTRLEIGPFSVRWSNLAAGRHAARICAMDRAGNKTCTQEIEVDIRLKTGGGFLYNTPGKVEI
jgi:membrane peptidoglycan carboxypeptidase